MSQTLSNLSVLMAVELMLARRELAISGSKILTDASKDSFRSVPFSADSLFGGKISEIQKANSEAHQQKLIRTQFLRNLALRNLSLHNLELHGFLERNKTPKRISLDHLDSFKVVEVF